VKKETQKKRSVLSTQISIGGVSLTQKTLLSRHLAIMLRSGLPITEALEITEESAEGKLRKVLASIVKSVRSGRSLSDSFGDHPKVFPGILVNAIKAGEVSGTLAENLENVSTQLEKEKQLVAKIKGAMIYPIIVLVATFGLGMVLSFFILPKITPLFKGLNVDLPATTRGLIWFSNVIDLYGIQLFLGAIGGAIFILWLLRAKFMQPITHMLLIKVPIVNSAPLLSFSSFSLAFLIFTLFYVLIKKMQFISFSGFYFCIICQKVYLYAFKF